MMAIFHLYAIVNQDGTAYIGTTRSFRKRMAEHRYALRLHKHGNPELQAAWDRDREGAFTFVNLGTIPPGERFTTEQAQIDAYGDCYNLKSALPFDRNPWQHASDQRAYRARRKTRDAAIKETRLAEIDAQAAAMGWL